MAKKDDNVTFVTKLMTISSVGALVHPFVLTALEYYSKAVLSKKDLEKEFSIGLVNPEAWKRCAKEVLQKVDKHLEREPSTPDHCPSCGVAIGETHRSNCNIEPCPNCGRNLYQCDCEWEEVKSLQPVRWTGEDRVLSACRQFGLYGRWLESGFEPCSKEDSGAEEDVERLYRDGSWDKAQQKWEVASPQKSEEAE